MKNVYLEFMETEAKIKELKGKLESLKVEIWKLNQEEYSSKEKGTITIQRGEYQLKVEKKVDMKISDLQGLMVVAPSIVKEKVTHSLDVKAFNSLPVEIKELAKSCVVEEVKKPSFKVRGVE